MWCVLFFAGRDPSERADSTGYSGVFASAVDEFAIAIVDSVYLSYLLLVA